MPTKTYKALANITLSSSAASVTFSNIPNTYRDLVLVYNGLATQTTYTKLTLNNDTGANYSQIVALGWKSNTTNSYIDTGRSEYYPEHYTDMSSTDRNMTITNIMDYSATDKHKTLLGRFDGFSTGSRAVGMTAGRWASTNAVTSIKLTTNANSYAAGSTFALYGIES